MAEIKFDFELKDDANPKDTIKGTLEVDKLGISLSFAEHGMFTEPEGAPIYIEFYNNEIRVHIWGDINEEDATEHISLEDARNTAATPETMAFWGEDTKSARDMVAAAASHHPECQCAICYYGADEWLRNFHASEY